MENSTDQNVSETAESATEQNSAAYLALILVQVFFGSLPVIGKVVLAQIPSLALVGSRVGITALILFIFQAYRKRLWLRERGDYIRLAILSLFGVTINQIFFVGGLSLTKASNTSLLAVSIPIFTLTISILLKTEKLRGGKVVGIILAAAGIVFLLDPRKASFSSQTTIGDLMIIINSLAFGIYVATSKEIVTRNGAFRSMMWVFIFASIICVPLGAYSLLSIGPAGVDPTVWLLVIYIGVFATAVPYLLNAWALARVSPSTLAVFIYLQPLIGFVLAVVFLDEVIDLRFLIAAALVFAGVFLASRKQIRTQRR